MYAVMCLFLEKLPLTDEVDKVNGANWVFSFSIDRQLGWHVFACFCSPNCHFFPIDLVGTVPMIFNKIKLTTLAYYKANNKEYFCLIIWCLCLQCLRCSNVNMTHPCLGFLVRNLAFLVLYTWGWSGSVQGWWVPCVIWPKFFLEVCYGLEQLNSNLKPL